MKRYKAWREKKHNEAAIEDIERRLTWDHWECPHLDCDEDGYTDPGFDYLCPNGRPIPPECISHEVAMVKADAFVATLLGIRDEVES